VYEARLVSSALPPTWRIASVRFRAASCSQLLREVRTGQLTCSVAEYDFREAEVRWQRRWDEDGTYRVDLDDPRPPYYVLCMYPYPAVPLTRDTSQLHLRDVLVRHRTMQGHAVLSPFGFDSFGLPAENAAIKGGDHPRVYTEARIAELTAR